MNKKFVSTMRKGFHMSFENGLTASVQWGSGNYCDNHYIFSGYGKEDAQSNTAEVAVWRTGSHDFMNPNIFVPEELQTWDEVIGYMTPEQVVNFLAAVKNWKDE